MRPANTSSTGSSTWLNSLCGNRALRLWYTIGVLAAFVQTCCMGWQYASSAKSTSLLACLVASAAFLLSYFVYFSRVRRGARSAFDKYFLICHLLVATWYFWIATTVYLFHKAGYEIMAALSDGEIASGPRALLWALFLISAASHGLDLFCIILHSRAISGAPVSACSASFLLLAAFGAVLVDVIVLICTSVSLYYQHDYGTGVLICLSLGSLIAQGLHARGTAMSSARQNVDAQERHRDGQMLYMQHALLTSTVFLVTSLLILLGALGTTLSGVIADDASNQSASVVVSLIAYAAIAVSTVVLVAMHTKREADAEDALGGGGAIEWDSGLGASSGLVPAPAEYHAIVVAPPSPSYYDNAQGGAAPGGFAITAAPPT